MARRLEPEEERRFLEALEESAVAVEDRGMSASALRQKEETPLLMSPELAAWLFEHDTNPFFR